MLGAQGISAGGAIPPAPAVKPGATVKSAAETKRLTDMAKEFEATFVSMLLKDMRQTLGEEDGLFPGDSSDVQGGLFDMFMSKHVSDGAGMGLAAALVRQMQAYPPAANAKPHPDAPDALPDPRIPVAPLPPATWG
jgi:peptidoglycan hydrolase FlgJ